MDLKEKRWARYWNMVEEGIWDGEAFGFQLEVRRTNKGHILWTFVLITEGGSSSCWNLLQIKEPKQWQFLRVKAEGRN